MRLDDLKGETFASNESQANEQKTFALVCVSVDEMSMQNSCILTN